MQTLRTTVKCLLIQVFLLHSLHAHSNSREFSCDSKEVCVVFVCNKKYFSRFVNTVQALTTVGNYHGDICLVIGNDLLGDKLLNHKIIKRNNVKIKHFSDLQFPDSFIEIASKGPIFHKKFQYHKLYLFDPYFKQWNTVLYLDCGMIIYSDIHPIIDTKKTDKLLAHSDAFPYYPWNLGDQFNKNQIWYYDKLRNNFNLDIDYFQTTLMLFDTNIIKENTFNELYNLALEYPISNTNDQGILALYFTNIVPVWEQIPMGNEKTFFYDFGKRKKGKYIMTKR